MPLYIESNTTQIITHIAKFHEDRSIKYVVNLAQATRIRTFDIDWDNPYKKRGKKSTEPPEKRKITKLATGQGSRKKRKVDSPNPSDDNTVGGK